MKTLYLYNVEDNELGEAQGVFDEHGGLLSCWGLEDANFRLEYMNELMTKLGYKVTQAPKKMHSDMKEKMRSYFNG
jgi:hypothetical protein